MSADREDAEEYLENGRRSINWSKLGGVLGRGSLYAMFLSLLGVFFDILRGVENLLETAALLPVEISRRARLGELTTASFSTALETVSGPGAFIISLVVVIAILYAIDRATILVGVR